MQNRIYLTEVDDRQVINIIGKLDSAEFLENFFLEVLQKKKTENEYHSETCSILIDLSKTELITDDCMRVFEKLKSKCSIEFKNYSLYVELLLRDNGLLKEKIS